jgi:membrane protease YdiL (CAAX protease family)
MNPNLRCLLSAALVLLGGQILAAEPSHRQVQPTLELAKPPQSPSERPDLVHFAKLRGNSTNPRFHLHLPPDLRSEHGLLAEDEERFAWIARRLETQLGAGDAASADDLGLLHLYGLGVERDLAQARDFLERGARERGKHDGLRHYAELRVLDPDQPAAARESAGVLFPLLEAGHWWACWAAFQANNHLTQSDAEGDRALADRLVGTASDALVAGFKAPSLCPPDCKALSELADTLCKALFTNPSTLNLERAEAIVTAWETALPQDVQAKIYRLGLYVARKDHARERELASELLAAGSLTGTNLAWVREVKASALLTKDATKEDLAEAEATLSAWLKEEPGSVKARLLLLQLHQARENWTSLFQLATEMLEEEGIEASERSDLRLWRILAAGKLGRLQDLEEADWRELLDSLSRELGLDRWGVRLNGDMLAALAAAVGLLWLFGLACITRWLRKGPPGYWICALWGVPFFFFGGSILFAPWWVGTVYSLLGIAVLLLAISGGRTPLGYVDPPQRGDLPRVRLWGEIAGLCVALFLLLSAIGMAYAWIYERLLGRELPNQLAAGLLLKDSLPGLLGAVLAGGLFIPLIEEVIFRGLFQDWVRRRLPLSWTILLVSLVFGLAHGLDYFIPIAFMGVLLGWLRVRYRSLWPPVLLHAMNNTFLIIVLYLYPELLS